MSNILLINPWIYDFAAYDLWAKPIGLLYIASALRNYGYEINFIDCLDRYHPKLPKSSKTKEYGQGNYYAQEVEKPSVYKNIPRKYKRYGLPLEVFESELKSLQRKPSVILVTSMMTYWYLGVFEVIKLIKDYFKDVPVFLGGIYATLCSDHALKYSGANYIIKGRNIFEVLKLVDNLTKNIHDYSNFPNDLDDCPYPGYDLIRNLNYVCILTSQGCPYNCTYCATHLLSPKFIQRNPIKVVDEIEYYYKKFKVKNIVFYDDALLINAEKHICVILEDIARRGIKCYFHTPNGMNINCINKELASLLFTSNFKTIRLSFETSSEQLQKSTGGKVTNQDLEEAIKNLVLGGYKPKDIEVYVMTGLPGQSDKEVVESIKFVSKTGAKIKLVEFSPIPNTREWSRAVNEFGVLPNLDPLLHNNSILLFQSRKSYQELKELARKLNE